MVNYLDWIDSEMVISQELRRNIWIAIELAKFYFAFSTFINTLILLTAEYFV